MKILLGTFKDNGEELASFLEPRIGAKPQLSGGELAVDDGSLKEGIRSRHVKTYIKRFLYRKGERKNYRVLVEGKELRIVELEREEEEEEEERPEPKPEEKKEEKEEKEPEPKAEEPEKEQPKVEEKKEEEKPKEPEKAAKPKAPRKKPAKKPKSSE